MYASLMQLKRENWVKMKRSEIGINNLGEPGVFFSFIFFVVFSFSWVFSLDSKSKVNREQNSD